MRDRGKAALLSREEYTSLSDVKKAFLLLLDNSKADSELLHPSGCVWFTGDKNSRCGYPS